MKQPARLTVEFGKRVRRRRTKLGISQEELGFRSGLHPTYVSGIERGERNLSLMNLVRLAQGLGVDPAQLVKGLRAPGSRK